MIGRTRSIISGKSIKVEFTQFQDNETIERLIVEGALHCIRQKHTELSPRSPDSYNCFGFAKTAQKPDFFSTSK